MSKRLISMQEARGIALGVLHEAEQARSKEDIAPPFTPCDGVECYACSVYEIAILSDDAEAYRFALDNILANVAGLATGDIPLTHDAAVFYFKNIAAMCRDALGQHAQDGEPPIAFDVAGRPYCSACGDSGSGPCAYHYEMSKRAARAQEQP